MGLNMIRKMSDNIIAANRRIKDVDGGARETPLDYSDVFSERAGANFLVKGRTLAAHRIF